MTDASHPPEPPRRARTPSLDPASCKPFWFRRWQTILALVVFDMTPAIRLLSDGRKVTAIGHEALETDTTKKSRTTSDFRRVFAILP